MQIKHEFKKKVLILGIFNYSQPKASIESAKGITYNINMDKNLLRLMVFESVNDAIKFINQYTGPHAFKTYSTVIDLLKKDGFIK